MEQKMEEVPEALDLILKYLVENKNEWVNIQAIHNSIFKGVENEIFEFLILRIIDSKNGIVEFEKNKGYGDYKYHIMLKGTALTEQFLNNGGYGKENADAKKEKELAAYERELARRAHEEQIKTNSNTRLWNIVNSTLVALSLLVAILAYLNSCKH